MTVWMFYLRLEGFDRPLLYAFTDNKEMAMQFRKERDENKLIDFKRKHFSEDDWLKLCGSQGKRKLQYTYFYTRFGGNYRKRVQVLCTFDEEEAILKTQDKIFDEMRKFMFDAAIFKQEYLVALEKLLYFKFYCFLKVKNYQELGYLYEPYFSNFEGVEGLVCEDFNRLYKFDELALFISEFQHLYK